MKKRRFDDDNEKRYTKRNRQVRKLTPNKNRKYRTVQLEEDDEDIYFSFENQELMPITRSSKFKKLEQPNKENRQKSDSNSQIEKEKSN